MTAVVALRLAKARIEKYGWHQGGSGSEYVGFCAFGALRRNGADVHCEFKPFGEALICLAACDDASDRISHWNDTPGRTKSEVLAAFDDAIEIAESLELDGTAVSR